MSYYGEHISFRKHAFPLQHVQNKFKRNRGIGKIRDYTKSRQVNGDSGKTSNMP